jgi:WhiB family redox-sensing transcriptional regulator
MRRSTVGTSRTPKHMTGVRSETPPGCAVGSATSQSERAESYVRLPAGPSHRAVYDLAGKHGRHAEGRSCSRPSLIVDARPDPIDSSRAQVPRGQRPLRHRLKTPQNRRLPPETRFVTVRRRKVVWRESSMKVGTTRASWDTDAACRGPQSALFFPPTPRETPDRRDLREAAAKQICLRCPVRRECLDYALRSPEQFGVWGGLNEDERRERSGSSTA